MAIRMSSLQRKPLKRQTVKDQSGAGKNKIGKLLSKAGYITLAQLSIAQRTLRRDGGRLGAILRHLEYIEDDTVFNFLSRHHNYPGVVIKDEPPSEEIANLLSYDQAKRFMALPLRMADETLQITMAEPTDTGDVEELQNILKQDLTVCVSTEKDIVEAYRKYYNIDEAEVNSLLNIQDVVEEDRDITQVEDFGSIVAEAADDFKIETDIVEDPGDRFAASDAPIIKLVNGILLKAVQDKISDVHIEPYEKIVQVRYRKDGSLFKTMNLPLTIKNALVARVKILAGLDITERRIPQDGRIKMSMGRIHSVDFRVSSLPTLFGESVVLRILDKDSLDVDLTQLGFEQETFEMLKRCLRQPQGMLLVTGPTGSGKTVTLYSALNSLNDEKIKILTAEDPVEFSFKGINQVHVQQEVGMTFAVALRAFLRQDPDIIMVGEIRDLETAEISIRAAMTGHLVFSTLHTNDSPATIGRLMDIGIPSYMLASSLTMVLSQRLGRKLCQQCKKIVNYAPEELVKFGFSKDEVDDLEIYGPNGCAECYNLGYKGRVGFFELMEITEKVAKAISAEIPEDQLRKIAKEEGMIPLRDAALQKVRKGITSIDEALKRTVAHRESLPAYILHPDEKQYEDGDIIIKEGNKDNDFFRLVRGTMHIVKGGKKIAGLSDPGEYFGEMAAITGERRSASVISQGKSTARRFPGEKIGEIIERYPDISKNFIQTAIKRLEKSNQIVIKLASRGKRN